MADDSPHQPHQYVAIATLYGTRVPIGTADPAADGVLRITFHRWPDPGTPGAWDGTVELRPANPAPNG